MARVRKKSKVDCPVCKSNGTQKVGTVMSRSEGAKQRYKCTSCGSTFYHRKQGQPCKATR